MENLNAETVKKAMECCQTPNADDCEKCEYRRRGNTDNFLIGCCNILVADALALITSQEQRIKELTEENERLRENNKQIVTDAVRSVSRLNAEKEMLRGVKSEYESFIGKLKPKIDAIKADTVRKMQERLKAKAKDNEWNGTICGEDIDQIAKEMLEGGNNND